MKSIFRLDMKVIKMTEKQFVNILRVFGDHHM